ncbi:SGT1 protein-domain-containing protein [Umbelopsis sp. PMI_123]|nr:SGT1 protein-domain-containing protein [Umbelopsis sp. PMI_123]
MEDNIQSIFERSEAEFEYYVKYSIYFPETASSIENLHQISAEIRALAEQITGEYLWQKDRFGISITQSSIRDPQYRFLHGITRYGDCVTDEWLVVYILKEISKRYKDAVVDVSDNDGEFLLIEAAMELPSWLDPSNSENRSYIYQDHLHIIPLPKSPAEIIHIPSGKLMRSRAIDIVRSHAVSTQASAAIEAAAFYRIKGFPTKAMDEKHRARCTVPAKLAYILLKQPQLISHAVEVFYTRDPSNMKAASRMSTFPPNEMVTTVVDMTKTCYAKLTSQQFYAPKPFRMPSRSNPRKFNAAELGMKIACAFEMLYTDKRVNVRAPTKDTTIEDYDFENDTTWNEYKKRLERRGYFKGELQGSIRYRQLEVVAKQQHLSNQLQGVDQLDEDIELSSIDGKNTNTTLKGTPQQQMDQILQDFSEANLEHQLHAAQSKPEDDDSWMNVNPQQLEELLKQYGGLNMNEGDFGVSSQEAGGDVDLDAIMKKFEGFVNYEQSGVEGAEFPRESLGEFSDDDEDEGGSEYESENDEISFDPNQFMNILRSTLGGPSEEVESHVTKEPIATTVEQQLASLQEISDEEAERLQKLNENEDSTIESLYNDMDEELRGHKKINASFHKSVRFQPSTGEAKGESLDEMDIEEDEDAPVDIELNLVKNMLESFKSQEGLPGPIGNIMNRMGIVMPRDEASMESTNIEH